VKVELITEPHSYRWERTIGGITKTGRGPVVQVYHVKGRGWYVVLHDVATKRPLTFRPAHILRRVRAAA
jgi:hypothetical protein